MLLGRQVLPLLLCVFLMLVPGWARGKLFVLTGESEIRQYDLDGQDALALEVTYTGESLPGIFPLDGFDVAAGNILRCYGRNQGQKGRLLYNQFSNRLEPYAGPPREGVKILEETRPEDDYRQATGTKYRDIFALEGHFFGLGSEGIDRLVRSGESVTSKTELSFGSSRLRAVAVSPWGEAFISDEAGSRILRAWLRDGTLVSNGEIRNNSLDSPGELVFSARGELFVAAGTGVLRFDFRPSRGIEIQDLSWKDNWRASFKDPLEVGKTGALDVALALPFGVVVSEKTKPIVRLSSEKAGGHHGISQSIFLYPNDVPGEIQTNSAGGALRQNVVGNQQVPDGGLSESKIQFSATGHDHSGGGSGNLISTSGLADDAVTEQKVNFEIVNTGTIADLDPGETQERLVNDEYDGRLYFPALTNIEVDPPAEGSTTANVTAQLVYRRVEISGEAPSEKSAVLLRVTSDAGNTGPADVTWHVYAFGEE